MKHLTIVLAVVFAKVVCFADASICDKKIVAIEKNRQVIEALRSYQGRFQLGECQVELHICDDEKSEENRGSLIGDILITNTKKEENYIPIFLGDNSRQTSIRVVNTKVMFNYFMQDRIKNPISGNLDEYRLEILKVWPPGSGLSAITAATYSASRDSWHLGQYTYRWSECFDPRWRPVP